MDRFQNLYDFMAEKGFPRDKGKLLDGAIYMKGLEHSGLWADVPEVVRTEYYAFMNGMSQLMNGHDYVEYADLPHFDAERRA